VPGAIMVPGTTHYDSNNNRTMGIIPQAV